MNKQEFIEYISKIPEEMDFTPMTVDVKAECPNSDGSYRTITKKIKFECTYDEMVHQLPIVKEEKVRKEETYEEIGEAIERELKREEEAEYSLFFKKVNILQESIYNLLVPVYGKNLGEVGEIPIFVLANLLLYSLKGDANTADFSCELSSETRRSLNNLIAFLT